MKKVKVSGFRVGRAGWVAELQSCILKCEVKGTSTLPYIPMLKPRIENSIVLRAMHALVPCFFLVNLYHSWCAPAAAVAEQEEAVA